MSDAWDTLRLLIKLNGTRGTLEPAATYPDAVLAALREAELQAKVLKVGEHRVVVYVTFVDSVEMIAVDVLR